MKTTTELQLRKIALVLTAVVLLQVVWAGIRLFLRSDPEPVVPAESSLRVDKIRYGLRLDDALSQDLVSRPVFWQGRLAYVAPEEPEDASVLAEQPRGSTAIDKVKLLGVYTGGDHSGIIVSYKGEKRRLRQDESIEDWNFTTYNTDSAVFESNGESKTLILEHAAPPPGGNIRTVSAGAAEAGASRERVNAGLSATAEQETNPVEDATNNHDEKGE
jgi:hypothetical protein